MAEHHMQHEDSHDGTVPSASDMQSLMRDKAHELFSTCDTEGKGFITKRDMQRLLSDLPLTPEQLEGVFDSLDDDGNGYLTLEEFTGGFGSFLGLGVPDHQPGMEDQVDTYIDEDEAIDPHEEKQNYRQMITNIGAGDVFEDEPAVQSLWCRLRREDADLAGNFEDFLYRVSTDLRKTKTDFETLEGALRSKSTSHDEEVRKLYEEMESQIKAEKERVLAEERAKEKQLRDQMESEILEKDRQLQEMLARQASMEEKLGYLNTVEAETKIENEKLMKTKEELEESLLQSQAKLDESQAYVNQLRQQQKDEKRARAKAALQLSEGIALERETLVKQLDMLKHMNRKLQDDKDEAEIRRQHQDSMSVEKSMEEEMQEVSPRKTGPTRRGDLARQGSVLGKYIDPPGVSKHTSKQQKPIQEDLEQEKGSEREGEWTGEGHMNNGAGQINNGDGLIDETRPMDTTTAGLIDGANDVDNSVEDMASYGFNDDRRAMEGKGLMDSGVVMDNTDLIDMEDDIECDDDIYVNRNSGSFIHPDIAVFNSNLANGTSNIRYRSESEEDEDSERDDVDGKAIQAKSVDSGLGMHMPGDNNTLNAKGDKLNKDSLALKYNNSQNSEMKGDILNAHNTDMKESYQNLHTKDSFQDPLRSEIKGEYHGIHNSEMKGGNHGRVQDSGTKGGNQISGSQMEQVSVTSTAITRFATPGGDHQDSEVTDSTPTSPRLQPVGSDGTTESTQLQAESLSLQRVFKVVIVGDSGVGKSSFLHRYCNNHFKQSYTATIGVLGLVTLGLVHLIEIMGIVEFYCNNHFRSPATIGVDFQIKALNLDGHNIVLQLWDTAGQERFRSITRQYFRKADGVIIMYDVSSETTFTNVRHWMTSVQEGVSDAVVLLLLGNKNDIPEDDDSKVVQSKHGSRLADGYDAMFYETSALTGENVNNAMEALARRLKEKEDREIEKSLHLEEFVKKKKCCR